MDGLWVRVFGLFRLLGYRFSPRLADIGGTRFWRIDPDADYGALNSIARQKINVELIARHWDDLLRLAGSLKLGRISPTSIMRALHVGDRPTRLAQALAEFGRIDKTLHTLNSINDEDKRRAILVQLNLSQQYGISEHESMSMLLGASIPGLGGPSFGRNCTPDEAANEAMNISNGEDFQRSLQNVNDFARSKAHTSLNDEGIRLADSTTRSIDETTTAQKQYSAAKNNSEQLSSTASWAEQNTQSIRKALNQDLVNWAIDNKGYEEAKFVLTQGGDGERAALISGFVSSMHAQSFSKQNLDINQKYEQADIKSLDRDSEMNNIYANSIQSAKTNGFDQGFVSEKFQELEANHALASESVHSEKRDSLRRFDNAGTPIQNYLEEKVPKKSEAQNPLEHVWNSFDHASDLAKRFYEGPINQVKLSGKYSESPLGWNE